LPYILICTSGTFLDVDDYASQIGLDDCQREVIKLTNAHVIKKKNVLAIAISNRGPTNFLNVYGNKDDKKMHKAYTDTLSKFTNSYFT
jgi:hypothetical protein